jgi:hypothetical protein
VDNGQRIKISLRVDQNLEPAPEHTLAVEFISVFPIRRLTDATGSGDERLFTRKCVCFILSSDGHHPCHPKAIGDHAEARRPESFT